MTKKTITFVEWLGYRQDFDFSKARWLGHFCGFLLGVAALFFVTMSFLGLGMLFAAFFGIGTYSSDPSGEAIRNLGLVVAAFVGAPFLLWRSIVSQKNAETAEQSQITDRINKAILALGAEKVVKHIFEVPRYQKNEDGQWSRDEERELIPARRPDGKAIIDREQYESTEPNIEVRVGAIFSLERIAKDSVRDHVNIMELLCTYIRENTRIVVPVEDVIEKNDATVGGTMRPRILREDIQAAMSVIGRRGSDKIDIELASEPKFVPDLRGARLDGVNARFSNFRGTLLDGSSWVGAELFRSDFRFARSEKGCDFSGANVEGVSFDHAWLHGIRTDRSTVIHDATFSKAHIKGFNFGGTQVSPSNFEGVMIFDCSFYAEELIYTSFANSYINDTSFLSARFFDVDFSGCNNWSQSQFDEAFGISAGEGRTILPDGAIYPSHWIDLSELGDEYDIHETFIYEYELWKAEKIKTF